jgi:hypothetical protein
MVSRCYHGNRKNCRKEGVKRITKSQLLPSAEKRDFGANLWTVRSSCFNFLVVLEIKDPVFIHPIGNAST